MYLQDMATAKQEANPSRNKNSKHQEADPKAGQEDKEAPRKNQATY